MNLLGLPGSMARGHILAWLGNGTRVSMTAVGGSGIVLSLPKVCMKGEQAEFFIDCLLTLPFSYAQL